MDRIDTNFRTRIAQPQVDTQKKGRIGDTFAKVLNAGARVLDVVGGGGIGSAVISKLTKQNEVDNMISQMRQAGLEAIMLQMKVSEESRHFNTLSNIMKTDHDARMAAIRNMKA
jgi:hypothetical protein